jgi:uncharacterized membrane protein YdbT with pleckstrin-like domain
MLCSACSTAIPAGAAFCPKCGQKVGAAPAATAPAPTPASQLKAAQAASAAVTAEPERQLWKGSYSPKAMIGSWLLALVVTIAAGVACFFLPPPIPQIVVAAVVGLLWLWLIGTLLVERLSVEYSLSTQRFVHQRGILRRTINRIELIDVDDVTVEQNLVERMFGVGSIKLLSSDVSDPKLQLRGIDDVKRVATMIDDARREERRKRSVYMETV